MSKLPNIHATFISFKDKGILFIGKSGAGKSDLALRMIMDYGAILVADDRVNVENIDGKLYGSAPKEIAGKMEIRNIGITDFSYKKKEVINLCVELSENRDELDRLPNNEFADFLGVSVIKIKLYPFDCSTICKIIAKISSIIS